MIPGYKKGPMSEQAPNRTRIFSTWKAKYDEKTGVIWHGTKCLNRLEIMTQVIPSSLTLPSCVSDGSRRSNSPAEKHISLQDFEKCEVSPLGTACICFSLPLCIFALYLADQSKNVSGQFMAFLSLFVPATEGIFVAPERSRT